MKLHTLHQLVLLEKIEQIHNVIGSVVGFTTSYTLELMYSGDFTPNTGYMSMIFTCNDLDLCKALLTELYDVGISPYLGITKDAKPV